MSSLTILWDHPWLSLNAPGPGRQRDSTKRMPSDEAWELSSDSQEPNSGIHPALAVKLAVNRVKWHLPESHFKRLVSLAYISPVISCHLLERIVCENSISIQYILPAGRIKSHLESFLPLLIGCIIVKHDSGTSSEANPCVNDPLASIKQKFLLWNIFTCEPVTHFSCLGPNRLKVTGDTNGCNNGTSTAVRPPATAESSPKVVDVVSARPWEWRLWSVWEWQNEDNSQRSTGQKTTCLKITSQNHST